MKRASKSTSKVKAKPKFKRILLKLSGEALGGDQGYGICPETVASMANQIAELRDLGVQVVIVVGGGNIFRGLEGEGAGLTALRAGRSYITNGPLLELRCGQRDIGDVIKLDEPKTLQFRARAIGRNDFRKLQLIHNGKVVKEVPSRKLDGRHAAILNWTLKADGPGWVALRVDSGFATLPATAPVALKGKGVNEFGQGLFGHTSPIYIDFGGKRMFEPQVARKLMKEMEAAVDEILRKSKFAGDAEKMRVLRVYTAGIEALEKRLKGGGD